MDNNIPIDRQRIDDLPNTDHFDDLIALAEECGLKYCGLNSDNNPEFNGTEKAWDKFEKAHYNLEADKKTNDFLFNRNPVI